MILAKYSQTRWNIGAAVARTNRLKCKFFRKLNQKRLMSFRLAIFVSVCLSCILPPVVYVYILLIIFKFKIYLCANTEYQRMGSSSLWFWDYSKAPKCVLFTHSAPRTSTIFIKDYAVFCLKQYWWKESIICNMRVVTCMMWYLEESQKDNFITYATHFIHRKSVSIIYMHIV